MKILTNPLFRPLPSEVVTIPSIQLRVDSATLKPSSAKAIPMVGPFFVCGAVFGFLGSIYLGVHLWLAMQGYIGLKFVPGHFRELHLLTQVYLFIGLFILGFIFQSSPRIVAAPVTASPRLLWIIPITLLGVSLSISDYYSVYGHIFISAAYLTGAIYIVSLGPFFIKTKRVRLLVAHLIGVLLIAGGPFLPLTDAHFAAWFFWASLGLIITASSEQFFVAFLEGQKLDDSVGLKLIFFQLITSAIGLVSYLTFDPLMTKIWGASICLFLLFFLIRIGFKIKASFSEASPLSLAFTLGYIWAMLGGVTLIFASFSPYDRALHAWVMGWAITLIFAISVQVLSWVSRTPLLTRRLALFNLWTWQPLVCARVGKGILPIGESLSYVISILAGVSFLIWLGALGRAIWSLARRAKQS